MTGTLYELFHMRSQLFDAIILGANCIVCLYILRQIRVSIDHYRECYRTSNI